MKTILTLFSLFFVTMLYSQNIDYTYLDGNGNKYEIFNNNTIHYTPVKKQNSSSGEYSGGQAGLIELDKSASKKLKSLIKEAIAAEGDHIDNREMGSGMIIWKKKKEEHSVILMMNSAFRKDLEDFLKTLL